MTKLGTGNRGEGRGQQKPSRFRRKEAFRGEEER